ncbi:hypothetical protein BC567DRAFT_209970 [Phyllosticta citribraziliensis]
MGTQGEPVSRDGDTSRTSVRSKVAELLALRDSISESAVSLDKFADEDAVRDSTTPGSAVREIGTCPPRLGGLPGAFPPDAFTTPTRIPKHIARHLDLSSPRTLTITSEHVLRPALSSSRMVLRPSASVPAFSNPLKSASSTGSNTMLNKSRNVSDAAVMSSRSGNQKKPSPSPSVKRNKVERLIKEHGSPPGMRVTAGGRIVPSDLRLGSPSFPVDNGSSNGSANGLNRGSGRIDRAPFDLSRSSSSMNSMHVNHQGAAGSFSQYAPFNPPPALTQYYGFPAPALAFPYATAQPKSYGTPSPSAFQALSVPELKKTLKKIQLEQRDLERSMVIQEGSNTADERKRMVDSKIRMINEADEIRREIKRLEAADKNPPNSASTSESFSTEAKKDSKPAGTHPSDFVNPPHGLGNTPPNPFMYATPPPGYIYPPPQPTALQPYMGMVPSFSSFGNQSFSSLDANAGFPSVDSLPTQDVNKSDKGQSKSQQKTSGHAARKSHALEIKDPRKLQELSNQKRSALDPTSPAYTPHKPHKSDGPHGESPSVFVPPSPSPIASPPRSAQFASNFPWLCEKKGGGPSPMRSASSSAHRPSASSINTADFFPHNPHEHSSSNYVSRKTQPVTPEKSKWENGPWHSDFLSPDPAQSLKAPQVSPVNGVTANMSDLALRRSSEAVAESGRLHVPRKMSREQSTDKTSLYTRRSSRKHHKESKTPAASTSSTLDFRNKSTGFLMGFSAGLAGQSVMGTEDLDYMQGWAQGLVQAKKSQDSSASEVGDSSVEEDFEPQVQSPPAFMSQVETPSRQVSTATVKPTPGPIERPSPGAFNSFTSDRSIVSDMGISAPTPKNLRAMSGQGAAVDSSIRDKIDSILTSNQTPIKKISGNEAEPQKNDKSEHSPSKLTRVFSNSQHSQQKGQRFSLSCLGDQRGQNRNLRLSYDGQHDDDMAELEGAFPTPQSPKAEQFTTRASPSKHVERQTTLNDVAGPSSASTPKKFKLSPSKDKAKNLKPEMEDPTTMSPAAKKKWKEGWKKKFHQVKMTEEEQVAAYRAQHPLDG